MSKKAPSVANVTPSVLAWAVQRSDLTQDAIAKKLRVSPEQLASWQRDTPPPYDKAEKLADVLGVPFGSFYLDGPPPDEVTVPDMRTMERSYKPSANFRQLVHDLLIRQDWYRELAAESRSLPLSFVGSFSVGSTVADVATDIRDTLRLVSGTRRRVYGWDRYCALIAGRAEDVGVLVMRSGYVGNSRRKVSREEVQGFAIADPLAPLVFVNSGDYLAPQVFTLAHELAHIWVGKSAISNPKDGEQAANDLEIFCNRVATEVLVPEAEFVSAWRAAPSDIETLSRRFWVSGLVIVRRARELGLISVAQAIDLRSQAIAAMKPRKEPKPGEKGPSYYKTAAVRAGQRFTDAVLAEVSNANITYSHAGVLLGMNPHTVAKFAARSAAP